jgi:hypothetical protein
MPAMHYAPRPGARALCGNRKAHSTGPTGTDCQRCLAALARREERRAAKSAAFDIREAPELADRWENGGRSHVIAEITSLTPARAAYVAMRVHECLTARDHSTHAFSQALYRAAEG